MAGVPRATLVILLGTLASFGLPEWPVLLIIGIDELMRNLYVAGGRIERAPAE